MQVILDGARTTNRESVGHLLKPMYQNLAVDMEARRSVFADEGFARFWERWIDPQFANTRPFVTNVEAGALMHHNYASQDKPFNEMTEAQITSLCATTKRETVKLIGLFEQFPMASGKSRDEHLEAFRRKLFFDTLLAENKIEVDEESGDVLDPEGKLDSFGPYDWPNLYWFTFVLYGPHGDLEYNKRLICLNPSNNSNAISSSSDRFMSRSASRRLLHAEEDKRLKQENQSVSRSLLQAVEVANADERSKTAFNQTQQSITLLKEMIDEEDDLDEKAVLQAQLKELRRDALKINAMQRSALLGLASAPTNSPICSAGTNETTSAAAAAAAPVTDLTTEPSPTASKKATSTRKNSMGQTLNKDGTPRKRRVSKEASTLTTTTTTTTTLAIPNEEHEQDEV